MPQIDFKQGTVICKEGDELQNLLFITKGSVETSFHGHPFRMEQGDTIGLCDLSMNSHKHSYTALTDVTVFEYPYEHFDTLEKIIRGNADVANLLVNSMCRQTSEILRHWSMLKHNADDAYVLISETYPEYERLCKLYALTPKKLSGLSDIGVASESDALADWVYNFYVGIGALETNVQKAFFRDPAIAFGFIRRSSRDIRNVSNAYNAYQNYVKDISTIFINSDGHDLFALISELHLETINVKGADAAVSALMARLLSVISKMEGIDPALYQERTGAYKDALTAKRSTQVISTAPVSATGTRQNLADSMSTILEYSEMPEEERNKLARSIHDFRALSDRSSSDDIAYRLRRELTNVFYEVYTAVFMKSLKDPALPTIIKMFLNFGYIDPDLAGQENAEYLYSIADSLKGDPDNGVYTVCEWLTAIYKGKKEPSRNDFDEDYDAHLRELKAARKINDEEMARLSVNLEEKLKFELENVFPIANKITFGRVTTFCPFFADHNVQRGLDTSLVTATNVKECLNEILGIDFSAYYRQTIYENPEIGVPKEYLHVEVLPDIILMPNVGTRGSMWQEMEGRKRHTPARIFLPLFLLDNMRNMLIRLTAEFRWEMCKRVQGVRWSDLSDPSLTSEFFNYLQFYRSNRDLSQDAKSAIKTELVRARNAYKTVFVSNYEEWIVYEANGSPRLNKLARRILVNYCPFKIDIRQRLMQNPQFAELLKRYDVKAAQRIHHLERVMQVIQQTTGKNTIPQEIRDEFEYTNN